jgi:hypothetical protein
MATVIYVFKTFGFMVGSTFMGYHTGFNGRNTVIRCLLVSLFLNAFMLLIKTGFIEGKIVLATGPFETGIYFWATFVGLVAMLIQSDEHYLDYHQMYNIGLFAVLQFSMAIYCLALMFLGSMLNIASYQNLGGTFMVLWGLDLERTILTKFKSGNRTIFLLIILANLYLLKQLITLYPEYFIIV